MNLQITGIEGIGEITPGADLAGILAEAATAQGLPLVDGDVLVVTQKVVSKAENRLVAVDPDDPLSHKAVVEAEGMRAVVTPTVMAEPGAAAALARTVLAAPGRRHGRTGSPA